MYQKDFILRMIEMIGDLIAGILGLIKKGDFSQASEKLDHAYQNFLKNDALFLKGIDKEILIDELLNKQRFTNGHLEILSGLFYAEAELLYAKRNQIASIEFYEKSFILLEYVIKSSKTLSFEKQEKLSILQNRIAQLMGSDS